MVPSPWVADKSQLSKAPCQKSRLFRQAQAVRNDDRRPKASGGGAPRYCRSGADGKRVYRHTNVRMTDPTARQIAAKKFAISRF